MSSSLPESFRVRPATVDDAPATYIAGQLRAIVGVELLIDRALLLGARMKYEDALSVLERAQRIDFEVFVHNDVFTFRNAPCWAAVQPCSDGKPNPPASCAGESHCDVTRARPR